MITIWPVQPLCVVWKRVFLRRPQRDNYCQLNYSGCSPCVFWLRSSDPLTLTSGMRLDLSPRPPPLFQPPNSSQFLQPSPKKEILLAKKHLKRTQKNAHILCRPSGKKQHAGSCMDVSFDFFVRNSRKILFGKEKKTHSKNPGCLTATHANTAIIGGRKLDSVAVTNSLVNWNKALCCYVKVSACNCSGCFEGFIIYIFLWFFFSSKGVYKAVLSVE